MVWGSLPPTGRVWDPIPSTGCVLRPLPPTGWVWAHNHPQDRSGNCRPSTGRLKTQCVEAILFEEVISTGSSSSSYKTSPNMDLPSTSNGLQGKFLRRCTNCKQCVHVRSNVCKFCQCDFRNSRELMKKEEEARFLLKGKKALERNTASRVLRRIENQHAQGSLMQINLH
ncbi:uncharacterized protein [Procambarus clarkii]|uniref:uncharacterized protein isoform X1 n=1 Tax=Procambarus clarkii TaxID=6728 RepID=UPI0037442B6B